MVSHDAYIWMDCLQQDNPFMTCMKHQNNYGEGTHKHFFRIFNRILNMTMLTKPLLWSAVLPKTKESININSIVWIIYSLYTLPENSQEFSSHRFHWVSNDKTNNCQEHQCQVKKCASFNYPDCVWSPTTTIVCLCHWQCGEIPNI